MMLTEAHIGKMVIHKSLRDQTPILLLAIHDNAAWGFRNSCYETYATGGDEWELVQPKQSVKERIGEILVEQLPRKHTEPLANAIIQLLEEIEGRNS